MNVEWICTNDYYREIAAAPDMAAKEQIFREHFGPLFEAMKAMPSPMPVPDDPLEAARSFGFLTPEHLTEEPEALRRLESSRAWAVGAQALQEGAARFAPYADRVTVEQVSAWLLLMDPAKAAPVNRGYTGFQFPGYIINVFDTPNDYNIPRLPGLVVHELHHLVRLGLFPWTMAQPYSVAEYVILEGMAESFAAQLFGEEVVGYYATDISEGDLATARDIIARDLDKRGDVRGYIFGDHFAEQWGFEKTGMPPFGGYAVGYQAVQAYLKRTGSTVEEATFVPADVIAAESGYFD